MDKLEQLTVRVWHHAGLTLEEIFDQYPSREFIVRRLLVGRNDPSDVITRDMAPAERERVAMVSRTISQLLYLCPNLHSIRYSRKDPP